jgi:ribonuclease R
MPRTAEGVVSANRAGFGFVRVEGQEDSVFLPPREMMGVMHGDRVRVSVERGRDGRYSGKLEKVLEHATKAFVGTLEIHGRTGFVTAADRRIGLRCLVLPADLNGARHGDWVIAAVTRYAGQGASPQARITRRLDPEQPVELASEAAIARFDLPREFSPEAVHEAQAYGNAVDPGEAAQRLDLRDIPLVTIDGEDAKDFDDAVYAEPHPKGFRLIVAIADVSYYVRRGTALDASARERGTSVYFPTRVIPMLPFELSNVLCSLQPKVDRLCFAADMIVSKQGVLLDAHFYPAVMRSAARLTYDKAFAALIESRPEARAELGSLVGPAAAAGGRVPRAAQGPPQARRARVRCRRGRVRHRRRRPHPARVPLRTQRGAQAHRGVHDPRQRGRWRTSSRKRGVGTLYRVHGKPGREEDQRAAGDAQRARRRGRDARDVTPKDFRAITIASRTTSNGPSWNRWWCAPCSRPSTSRRTSGTSAWRSGTTRTSPRRSGVIPTWSCIAPCARCCRARIPTACVTTARSWRWPAPSSPGLEKRADESDRYVSAWLKCVYLRDRIGQTFEGLITTVVEFGAFVQLTAVGTDGLLHIDNLRDDDYHMEQGGAPGWAKLPGAGSAWARACT